MKDLPERAGKCMMITWVIFLIFGGTQVVAAAYPPNGLVAAYLFNGNPDDSSGNGNHGTLYGATTPITDRFGSANSAYRFNSKNDYIAVPGMGFSDTSFTLSAWIRVSTYATGTRTFIRRGNHANYLLGTHNTAPYISGAVFVYSADPPPNYNPNRVLANNVISLDQWMLVTALYDRGQGKTRLYVNCALVGDNPGALDPHDPGRSLEIGNWYGTRNGWNYPAFVGDIDDVLIYGRALSDLEIQSLCLPANQTPPVADAGFDETVECTDERRTAVLLDGSGSYDPDGDPLDYEWTFDDGGRVLGEQPTVLLPLGTYSITLTVDDGNGVSDDDEVMKSVEDTIPPAIQSLTADPSVLWPPNHTMRSVSVDVDSSDLCDRDPECWITGVTSNEPEDGLGDGETAPDWVITGDLTVDLRAERSGKGSGRIYTLEIACGDACDNVSTATATVTVPANRR